MTGVQTCALPISWFRRLAVLGTQRIEPPDGLEQVFFDTLDGELELSAWGQLLWSQAQRPLYEESVHPSPSPKIVYGPNFARSVENLEARLNAQINKRIDDLMRRLEKGTPLKRLDLKTVKGNPPPHRTHEIDAWADQDAKRIFLRLEDNIATLDALDRALH